MILMRIAMVLVLFWGMSCDHADPHRLSSIQSLRGSAEGSFRAPALLAGHALRKHADFDALENDLERRSGLKHLLPAYETLHQQRPDDVLLGARLILLTIRTVETGRIQRVIPIVDRLRQIAPQNTDVLYASRAHQWCLLHSRRSDRNCSTVDSGLDWSVKGGTELPGSPWRDDGRSA